MTFMSCFMFRTHMVPLLAVSSQSYISALQMAIHLPRTFGSPVSVSERFYFIPENLTEIKKTKYWKLNSVRLLYCPLFCASVK